MLEEINELLKSTNEAEIAFEELRNQNENAIKELIKNSQAYKELKKECKNDYKCFISILSNVNIVICYKLYDSFHKQSVYVTESGVDSERNDRAWVNAEASNKLNHLAAKFYEEFYLEEK